MMMMIDPLSKLQLKMMMIEIYASIRCTPIIVATVGQHIQIQIEITEVHIEIHIKCIFKHIVMH